MFRLYLIVGHQSMLNLRSRNMFFNVMKFSSATLRNKLCGRDILQPNNFILDEWKRILWIALDLKHILSRNNKTSLNILCNKHVTLLFVKSNGRNLLSCSLGSQILGARSTHYIETDFESHPVSLDSGKALSKITDLILVNGCNQAVLSSLADGSSVPVIGLSTNKFSILLGVALLMTILEKYGCIKRLKLAWIGTPNSVCNTVLSLFPLFGINIKFCCLCAHGSGLITPVGYESALQACHKGSSEIHQCSTASEALHCSHVIVVSSHPEEQNKITLELMEKAEFDWIFVHVLPRAKTEVSDDVFQHKNNLTWNCSENHLYVAMALMVSALTDYKPSVPVPRFDGYPNETAD